MLIKANETVKSQLAKAHPAIIALFTEIASWEQHAVLRFNGDLYLKTHTHNIYIVDDIVSIFNDKGVKTVTYQRSTFYRPSGTFQLASPTLLADIKSCLYPQIKP